MSEPSKGKTKEGGRRPPISFAFSFVVLVVVCLAANILQILADRWLATGDSSWRSLAIAVGAVFAVVATVVAFVYREVTIKLFASLRFAATVVLVLILATALGTLILQNQPPEAFGERYGGLTTVLRALHIGSLFHSFWYLGLLALMAVALTVDALLRIEAIVRGKRNGWANAGFIATHFGIVLVLAGGLLSLLGGDKGMIHLIEGMSSGTYTRSEPGPAGLDNPRSGKLPFDVRLDRFEVEHYPDDFSLYLYQLFPGTNARGRRNLEVIGALRSEQGDRRRFAGGYELSVVQVIAPTAQLAGEAPSPASAAGPHAIALDEGQSTRLRVGESMSLGDGVTLKALRFLPHFNYDLKTRQAVSLSDEPENPALEVLATRDADGETVYRGWLFSKHPGFSMDGHGGPLAKRLVYHYQRGAGAGGQGQQTIVLRLTRDGAEVVPAIRLAVGDSVRIPVEGGEYAVAYSKKGDRIKQFHSTVTLLRDGEELLARRPLSVNHSVSFDGWSLYQANFDPRNPRYSGIEVVRDPGLTFVYLGLVLLILGVFHILYFRRRRPGKKKTAPREEAVNEEAVAGDEHAAAAGRGA